MGTVAIMADRVWVSAHVFHNNELDDLLRARIVPEALALLELGLAEDFFYLRYWESGPHVRVRFLASPDQAASVRQRFTASLEEYFAEHPSQRPVKVEAYQRLCAQLANFERRRDYDRCLAPVDSVRYVGYLPEYTSFGSGESLRAVHRHFGESSRIAGEALTLPSRHRAAIALAMTLAVVATSDITTDALPQVSRTRVVVPFDIAAADRAWSRTGEELIALTRRMTTTDPDHAQDSVVTRWLRSVRSLHADLTSLQRQGAFAVPARNPLRHAMSRCLHLHLNRLGLSIAQEVRLRYLANRVVTALGAASMPQ
jgi:hypothetical protein